MKMRIVQTSLEESEYEQFKRVSEKHNKTLRQAAREAIERWTEEASGISANDPIFKLKPVSYKTPRAAERHNSILYGGEL